MPGKLYLVPTPLDFGCGSQAPLADVLPPATIAAAARLTHWVAENAKSARAFLKRVNEAQPLAAPIQQLQLTELPREVHKKGDHAGGFDARPLIAPALQGHDLGLLSEAGMPAVADPGSSIVRAAHDAGIAVVPLTGPVSLLLALAASGLNGQNFAFVGYLPQQPAPRAQAIRDLEALSRRTGQTQLFIETPYRNAALWQSLLETLKGDTRVAFASGLTLPAANIASRTAAQWKTSPATGPGDAPAVFLIGV